MPIPGVDVAVSDEALIARLPTATDTVFLLSGDTNAPTSATLVDSAAEVRSSFSTATTLITEVDTLFGEGARQVYLVKIDTSAIATALAKFPVDLGPGTVVAPPVQVAGDIADIADWAWETNRIYLANGPSAATNSQLVTLAGAIQAAGEGRNTALFADQAIVPGAGGVTRNVPWSIVVAGLIARNDLRPGGGNPNLAVAGTNVIPQYATGVTGERNDTDRETLNDAQVNTAKTVAGQLRNYGYRTLADLDDHPQWWDLGGARVVMDVKAHIRSANEDAVFGQIDGVGSLEDRVNGLISARCLELTRIGALFAGIDDYGRPIAPFEVDTSRAVNPLSEIQQGRVRADVRLRTSPYLEHLDVTIYKQTIA